MFNKFLFVEVIVMN